MSFWSLSLGQESVSSLFSTLATPIQGIAAIPAAALGTVGHSLTSAQTFAPKPIPQTSKINDVATATPHTAFYDFSSPSGNLLSMYNTLVMNSAANVAALVAPVSEYVPAPLAALAAYAPANPFTMATTPPRETECLDKKIANNSASAASIMGSAPPTQTAPSFALLSRNAISPQVLTPNSPAMTLFMALATNPQVQGMVATAIAGLVSSTLPTILRNAPSPSGGALLQSVLSAAPPPPLPAVPSPTLNNRLNFGPNTISAALMNVVAAQYAREFGENKPIPTTSGTNPSMSAPATTVPAVALNANPSGMRTLPSTIIDLFGTVAIPMVVNAISSTVKAAKRTPNVAKASSASVPSPTPDAALAVVSPIRQELQRVAIFAGRNAALAVLYYVLIKYFGPAGLSVKVAFTLATLLMDVLI